MNSDLSIEETNLDCDLATFQENLVKSHDIIMRLYSGLEQARITPSKSRAEIAAVFDEPLPETSTPIEEVLKRVENDIYANSTLSISPRFLGYINSGGNQAAILGDLLASAVNQVVALWHFSPSATEVERRVLRWIAEFIGYPSDCEGSLLSGGSAGNFVGLAVARSEKAAFDIGEMGAMEHAPLTVYASSEAHASIDKGMSLLGMGRRWFRRIPARPDFTMDISALAQRVSEDRNNGFLPICVVGTAGTTNTGAVDPLYDLAAFCREQGLWFHVDAAYGGPAASTSIAGGLLRGLDQADSVSVNPHKWLYVQAEAGCILVRKPSALRQAFRTIADYFHEEEFFSADRSIDFKDYGPQLHRSFRALKIWLTFKTYGARRLRAAIQSNIETMRYLSDLIDKAPDFVLSAPTTLSVVCFQYRTDAIRRHDDVEYLNHLNDRLLEALEKDGRVFLSGTTIRGRRVLRACTVNHRFSKRDADFVLDVVREVGSSLA